MKTLGYIEYIACGFIGDMMLIISFMILLIMLAISGITKPFAHCLNYS